MGICEDAPDEYCGHVLEPEDAGVDREADDDWHERTRNAVCLREPTYDGLCVWHADTDEKTAEELVESRLTPEEVPWETEYVKEHLNGAILRGIEFPEGFSFGGCVLIGADLRCTEFRDSYIRNKFSGTVLGKADFSGADLQGSNFHDTDLREADFSGADLQRSNFHDTDLREADFSGADLQRSNFHDTDLRKADFSDAKLNFAKFPDADLRYAEFSNASLRSCEFSDADLQLTDFSKASLRSAEFPNAKFLSADFSDADLYRAKFPGAELYQSKFSDASLRYAEFSDTDLYQAEFPNVDLRLSKFPGTDVREAEFPGADLREAEFPDADLREAEFPDADLREAEFPDADLREVKFSDTELQRVEFPGTDLRGVELSDADLQGIESPRVDFRNAEFRNVNFRGVELFSANFKGATFHGTDLYRATLTETNLQGTEFSETDLRNAKFRPAYARNVDSEKATPTDPLGASLENAQLEGGTDLRGTDLSGARLYQTAFRDVRINDKTKFGVDNREKPGRACRYEYDPNTGVSTNEDVSRLRAAAWTHRRLESLFEENAMDQRARNAHIRKEEAQRTYHSQRVANDDLSREDWLTSLGQYAVSTLNWHLHRHGESLRRLLGVSILLILGCGILYPFVGGIDSSRSGGPYRITSLTEFVGVEGWVDVANGIYFSAITFTTIGYGDFYPAGTGSRVLVALESLTGALLIALFVFVIGRRVAR